MFCGDIFFQSCSLFLTSLFSYLMILPDFFCSDSKLFQGCKENMGVILLSDLPITFLLKFLSLLFPSICGYLNQTTVRSFVLTFYFSGRFVSRFWIILVVAAIWVFLVFFHVFDFLWIADSDYIVTFSFRHILLQW